MIVDSHCHLDMVAKQSSQDLNQIIKNAHNADVQIMHTISITLSNFHEIIKIANSNPSIYASVGIHPLHIDEQEHGKDYQEYLLNELIELSKNNKVISIGETGLDYFYTQDSNQHNKQKDVFISHINAAQKTNLPLVIHSRSADRDMEDITKTLYKEQPFGAVMHCFTSSIELAKASLDLGFYISISGIVTFKNAKELRSVVEYVPVDRLLIETDAPYLAPQPHRGKINEPSLLVHTAQAVADIKGVNVADINRITTDNFFNLFTKAAKI